MNFEQNAGLLREECMTWLARGAGSVRIWCASAAGEEPYTLGVTLAESLDEQGVDWRLLASDVSVTALRRAAAGVYEPSQLEQLSQALRQRYFEPEYCDDAGLRTCRVVPALRSRIAFERIELSRPPFAVRGELDAIFCRNVLSDFDGGVRQRLVSELERNLLAGSKRGGLATAVTK